MNIDKIKISIGEPLYDFIGGLDREKLQKMKAELTADIEEFGHLFDYLSIRKRQDELWLINYRLGIY